ncbi:MAG TPA: hypothetical protein VGN00_14180 [Puia sp.]|jgi:hypothetical protein
MTAFTFIVPFQSETFEAIGQDIGNGRFNIRVSDKTVDAQVGTISMWRFYPGAGVTWEPRAYEPADSFLRATGWALTKYLIDRRLMD